MPPPPPHHGRYMMYLDMQHCAEERGDSLQICYHCESSAVVFVTNYVQAIALNKKLSEVSKGHVYELM